MLPEVWLSSFFFFWHPLCMSALYQGSGVGRSISPRAGGRKGEGGRCAFFFWWCSKISCNISSVCAPVLLSARLPRHRGWQQVRSLLSSQGMFCLYMTFSWTCVLHLYQVPRFLRGLPPLLRNGILAGFRRSDLGWSSFSCTFLSLVKLVFSYYGYFSGVPLVLLWNFFTIWQ